MSTDTTAAAPSAPAPPARTAPCPTATARRWPGAIERRWQDRWENEGTFHAPNPSGPWADPGAVGGEKVYLLDMFPYPSGSGLHVGHPLGFIGTDVLGRYLRMTGRTVLHAMGFDAFGLPAEQYAVQTGTHPRKTTEDNIQRYKAQLRQLGLGHDDRRSVATTDVEFYRWTQWIFLQIYNSWYDEARLTARPIAELEAEYAAGTRRVADGRELGRPDARRAAPHPRLAPAGLHLGGAGELVPGAGHGAGQRGGHRRRAQRAGQLPRVPPQPEAVDDADHRLRRPADGRPGPAGLARLGQVDAAQLDRPLRGCAGPLPHGRPAVAGSTIEVFTTRPDTLFGATYMVLAPEHPLVDVIAPDAWPAGVDARWTGGAATPREAVAAYRDAASRKSELDRQENKDKTGVFTGAYATNPVNGERDPRLRRRLRADGLRHRRDHGRARAGPARLGLRHGVRPADRPHRAAADGWDGEAFTGDGPAINSANAESA